MFEGAFSFRGRIGRLNYFLGNLLLLPVVFVGVLVVGFMIATAQRTMASLVFFGLLGLMVVIGLLWYSLSLQVRRIRDIGWDPLLVLGGVFFLLVADAVVARYVPAAAAGHSGTLFGALLKLALTATLYLWPGNGDAGYDKMASIAACFDAPDEDAAPIRRVPSLAPAAAVAVAGVAPALSQRVAVVPRKTFGKRGVR